MKSNKSFLLFLTIVIVVGALILYIAKNKDKNTTEQIYQPIKESSVSVSVVPTTSASDYSKWNLFKNGYAFPLPPKWRNTSDIGGTAVLEPGKTAEGKIGSIQKISVTILSDAKAAGKPFTSQKEFDDWSKVEGQVQGSIQKIGNITVDNENAIELLDSSNGENNWMVIAWIRKDNMNIYINFRGNKIHSPQDTAAIDYILSHFTFTAPETNDKEK